MNAIVSKNFPVPRGVVAALVLSLTLTGWAGTVAVPRAAKAAAKTIYVSTTGSDVTGDGTKNKPYATIHMGVASSSGGDTIDIASGTYTEYNINIKKYLTLQGVDMATTIVQAHVEKGEASNRVFSVAEGDYEVTFKRLTIRHGFAGIDVNGGGAILFNGGKLTLEDCEVSGNFAGTSIIDAGGGGINVARGACEFTDCVIKDNWASLSGGGVSTAVPAYFTRCEISGNSADGYRDATYSYGGGGVRARDIASFDECAISGNWVSAGYGGGVEHVGGKALTFTECEISGNSAEYAGGGVYGAGAFTECEISQNSAVYGGGVYGASDFSYCSITENVAKVAGGGVGDGSSFSFCVIDGNRARAYSSEGHNGAFGGGVWSENATFANCQITNNMAVANVTSGLATAQGGGLYCPGLMENCLIYGNKATAGSSSGPSYAIAQGGGIYYDVAGRNIFNSTISVNYALQGGGIYNDDDDDINANSVIIAGNENLSGATEISPDMSGMLKAKFCLIQDNAGCILTPTSCILGEDPLLSAPAYNGGVTKTMALADDSPAKDTGSNPRSLITDQRGPGYARTYGKGTDIGSYEIQPKAQYFTVTFNVATGGGTVVGPNPQTVALGADCEAITAQAVDGYEFVKWTKDGADYSTNNPLTVTCVVENMTVTAVFQGLPCLVTFAAGTGGTLSGATSQVVPYGGSSTPVEAKPSAGYKFVKWTRNGGDYSTANPLIVTNVIEPMTLYANFALSSYTVTFSAGTGGTLSGATSQTVTYGGSCSAVTAVPNTGYKFVKWTKDGGDYSTDNPLTVIGVAGNMVLIANFALDVVTRAVTFVEGAGGTIEGTKVQVVNYGGDCSAVTAIPNAHYHFTGWTGDYVGTTNPLTITNVTKDMTITANFAIDTYTVTFVEGAGGTIDGAKVQVIGYGGDCSAVTAVPNVNYHFVDWTGDYAGTTNPLTITDVTKDMTITANFAIDIHTVTFVEGANGTIEGTKTQVVEGGADCSPVTAVPNANYRFIGWTGDYVGMVNPLTVTDVVKDMTITANFAAVSSVRTITGSGGAKPSVSVLVAPPSAAAAYAVEEVLPVGLTPSNINEQGQWDEAARTITWTPADNQVRTFTYALTGPDGDYALAGTATFDGVTTINTTGDSAVKIAATHTVTFVEGENGTIEGTKIQVVVDGGDCLPVTAAPDTGYRFDGWTGDYVGTANPLTIAHVTKDMIITANFAARTYHSADYNPANWQIDIFELLRVAALFNDGLYYKVDAAGPDGFNPSAVKVTFIPGTYHSADYNPADGQIDIFELSRVTTLFNNGLYYKLDPAGPDGYNPSETQP